MSMNLLRHGVAAIVLFVAMIGLLALFVNDLTGQYNNDTTFAYTSAEFKMIENSENVSFNFTVKDSNLNGTVFDQLNNMLFVKGINEIKNGILELTAGGSLLDISSGLLAAGVGAAKTVIGIFEAPFAITSIINQYYGTMIPGAIIWTLIGLVTVYAVFIILSAFIGRDI